MPHLIAQGAAPQHRWRRRLIPQRRFVLGRAAGPWRVAWDDRISGQHVEGCYRHGLLEVAKVADAKNPVFYQGRARDEFTLQPGEHFVIGSTSFVLVDERVDVTVDVPRPLTERAFSPEYLQRVEFRDAAQRIETLSRLPEIIADADDDEELCGQLVSVLLAAIGRAGFVGVVRLQEPQPDGREVDILHWDSRASDREAFTPSVRLIRAAVTRRESIVHMWAGAPRAAAGTFTESEAVDWAFCTPVSGEACRGWAIYVAGRAARDGEAAAGVADPADLQDDLKFTELAATTLGSLRTLRQLERQKASLSQFISPVVLAAVADRDPDLALAPRQAEVTVLFCDLRGFSLKSERASDNLMGLLNRVSRALGVMTHQILDQGGVIGDFHGDAAMGFWGWPLAQEDRAARACRAALAIRREFAAAADDEEHTLHDFRVGIGLASGTAVAGKIGTIDQVKVTVFGPVVNLAARLESMTKLLRAPILIDEVTAADIRRDVPPEVARLRRVARVKPYGIEQPLEVSELLPPRDEYPELLDENIAAYEAALDALQRRDWDEAFALLHHVPAEDRVKDFLTVFIAQNNRTPPADWDGVIPIATKL